MTQPRVAIAVIHGMGEHRKADPHASGTLSYSAALRAGILRYLPATIPPAALAWREIFWSDVIQSRQDTLIAALKASSAPSVTVGMARTFIINSLGDAACYYPSSRPDSVYRQVHARIATVIDQLAADTGGNRPLLLFAHSLGGHMLSNYIWDTTRTQGPASFARFGTLAGIGTFGCNIPVFASVHKDIEPIEARRFAGVQHLLPTWWRNYFAKADPLSYPLRVMAGGYAALGKPGPGGGPAQLTDHAVVVGNPLTFWNPAAHAGYWSAEGLHRPLAAMLAEAHART